MEQLQEKGLPILHQASIHALEDRILLSGWKNDSDGTVETASYKQVLSRASNVSQWILQSRKDSDKAARKLVAHLNVPGWEYVASQWGAWGAGYGSVPLALSQKVPEIEHVLTEANPQYILLGGNCHLHSDALHAARVPPNANDLVQAVENLGMTDRLVPLEKVINDQYDIVDPTNWILGTNGTPQSLDEPALLLFTSGTTGKPKAAVMTHRNVYHQVTDLVAAWEWNPSDIALHLLPLHHQWAAAETALPKPNVLMAVPTIYAKLLEAAEKLPKDTVDAAVENTFRPMRLMVCGSAALPVSVLERWRSLSGHTLLERYGMTEFAMALSNPYCERDDATTQIRRPGYVGRPLPSVQVRLVDTETEEIIETPGLSGELQVKGPTVFKEYLNRPDSTKEAFTKDGFFRTGDIAQYDGDSIQSYRILGRASVDIIKSGAYKLSALEIERALLEHPDIAEVAVLGVLDDVWGERVALVCRMKAGYDPLSLEELIVWCAQRMSNYKVPSLLKVVSDIPKNAMGKVNKKGLAKLFDPST